MAGGYQSVQPGDCIVAFSRRDIYDIKQLIEQVSIPAWRGEPPCGRGKGVGHTWQRTQASKAAAAVQDAAGVSCACGRLPRRRFRLHPLRGLPAPDPAQETKHRCCVVYGALPPETRRQQAKLFNEPGECPGQWGSN